MRFYSFEIPGTAEGVTTIPAPNEQVAWQRLCEWLGIQAARAATLVDKKRAA